jgi:AAA+ superfamily predicted ATPase
VKALINQAKQPCLYVKSFKSNYGTEHDNIRSVFTRARHTTPSIVVLEDLDSLIDDKSRSFFLNELDGFALNTGVVVLATTNHPERLDPAILDRPSRFDRKYYFALPAEAERLAYVRRWNASLEPELKMSEPLISKIAEQTEGFSFAYMKELFLSSMMQWIAQPEPDGMGGCMTNRVKALREQMTGMNESPSLAVVTDRDEAD